MQLHKRNLPITAGVSGSYNKSRGFKQCSTKTNTLKTRTDSFVYPKSYRKNHLYLFYSTSLTLG